MRTIIIRYATLRIAVAACAVAAAAFAPATVHASDHPQPVVPVSCPAGDYENSDNVCIERPGADQPGATASCHDGTYSYATQRNGACSGHGGVDQWLAGT